MKRILFIIFAIISVYLLWPEPEVELESDEDLTEQIDEYEDDEIADSDPVPTAEPTRALVQPAQKVNKPIPTIIQKTSSKGSFLPPGVVQFRLLKNNWAVTHGDILLGKLESKIQGNIGQFKPKPSVLWDSAEIPYAFGPGFSKERTEEIIVALQKMSQATIINFLLVDTTDVPKDYIIFLPSDEVCASYLGKVGGQQPIFLKDNCGEKEIMHEAMHALGFVHEQSRKDRDQFVKINWDNIKDGYDTQFQIAPDAYLEHYRGFVFAFDYESIMLYSSAHFTKSPQLKTIESTTNKQIAPSQNGLSAVDIQRINYLYNK